MLEKILYKSELLGLIVRHDYDEAGVSFFTDNDFSQQLAYMQHPKGKVIDAHVHNLMPRTVHLTQEVLFIKKGKLRVDFYNSEKEYIESRVLCAGDVILLANGGHGFEVLEEIEMIEVKQGPYAGDQDKTRFASVESEKLKVRGSSK